MCNYILQNALILILLFLYWFYYLKKKSLFYSFKSEESFKTSWNKLAYSNAWIAFTFTIIMVIISIIKKHPSLSIILKIFGIKTCE